MAGNTALHDDIRFIKAPMVTAGQDIPRHVLVFFVTGNPGLVEYYRDFLNHLHATLTCDSEDTVYHIAATSLRGFEVQDVDDVRSKMPPYGLQEQIEHVEKHLTKTSATIQRTRKQFSSRAGKNSPDPLPILLVGHSVGSYILLEVIARRQAAQRSHRVSHLDAQFEIKAGVCLFPTVVDIVKSPNGRRAAPFALLPGFAIFMHTVVKLLCLLVPAFLMTHIVRMVTGQSHPAVKITTAFLRSKNGVRQALHMARDEFREINDDKWDDALWNGPQMSMPQPDGSIVPSARIDKPKLFFYWGENDHWIDNKTRDTVIATRARTATNPDKPHMEIDTIGVPHDFCITGYSGRVADKVAQYVKEVIG